MEDTVDNLMDSLGAAEMYDAELSRHAEDLGEMQGCLEALADIQPSEDALVGDEPKQLTDHQQERVDDFKTLAHAHKGEVYGVIDNAALEGFLDMSGGIFRKVVQALSKEVPAYFKSSAKSLKHYVDLAQRLRGRLQQLRPLLEKREFPMSEVFDYGAHSRFFQVAGKPIGLFSDFADTMETMNAAMRHVYAATDGYSNVLTERLLASLQELQAMREPDAERLIDLRDSIERHWLQTWKEAEITKQPGQTPQTVLNAFPERKFTSLAALLDNRYLVAHAPKSNGGKDPAKITGALRHYGATLVFDKAAKPVPETTMNVPNCDEMLRMVDETIAVLSDMRYFDELAKKNEKFAKDFEKVVDVLNKQAQKDASPAMMGFFSEYFKIMSAVVSGVQQPYTHMAWMYIRCGMVVASLGELSVIEPGPGRVALTRFFTQQRSDFANAALESYELTTKALKAAQRVSV